MNAQDWIEEHPYLDSIARFEQLVDYALDAAQVPQARPHDDAAIYVAQLERGTPLLSGEARPDLTDAAQGLRQVAEVLATEELPSAILDGIVEFRELSREAPEHAMSAIEWVIAPDGDRQDHPAIVRLLAWRVLRRVLERLIGELSAVRDSARWPHRECPTCGAVAALARIIDSEAGRQRMLVCACCQTSWKFDRAGCQYCGNESAESLPVLELENERQHRLDLCDSCGGYTKTFVGADAHLFVKDWPTLHLDSIATGKGYRRFGATLYDVSGTEPAQ